MVHRKMKTHKIIAGLVLATYWLTFGECLGQSPTLLVDRLTGTGTITNDEGTLGLTGYTIRSENLLKLAGWLSLEDQSITGWLEANPKATVLAEINASDQSTLDAGGAGLGIGSLFTTGLRPVFEDVSFEVTTADGQFLEGAVRYTGPANSVTLRIDPATGSGQLENFSTLFEDDVTGYSIFSPSGALSTNWTSLEDSGVNGWLEANPKTTALAEINASSSTMFSTGTVHDLGNVWDNSMDRDLVLNYLTRDGELLVGAVDYGAASLPSFLPADFDESGTVDFADFLFLSGMFGNAVDPAGTNPDIDGSGIVDFADFLVLSGTFGQSAGAAAAVPEPTALSLIMFGGMLLGLVRRKRSSEK